MLLLWLNHTKPMHCHLSETAHTIMRICSCKMIYAIALIIAHTSVVGVSKVPVQHRQQAVQWSHCETEGEKTYVVLDLLSDVLEKRVWDLWQVAAFEAETPPEPSWLVAIKINNAHIYKAQISPQTSRPPWDKPPAEHSTVAGSEWEQENTLGAPVRGHRSSLGCISFWLSVFYVSLNLWQKVQKCQ